MSARASRIPVPRSERNPLHGSSPSRPAAADELSFRVKIAFFCDPFVRLAATLDSIFELAVFLGQLRYYLIRRARGVTIEERGLQKYTSSDPESVRDFVRRGRRLSRGTHTNHLSPDKSRSQVGALKRDWLEGWMEARSLQRISNCALAGTKSSTIRADSIQNVLSYCRFDLAYCEIRRRLHF
jgi:hypothetical protein